MVRAPKQVDRFLTVETPLGPDVLVATGLEGEESFSRMFRFRLEMLSPDQNIDPNSILRKPVTVSVECERDRRRYFHGIVRTFSAGGILQSRLRRYTAEVVPNLWLLTRNTDCKVFQDKTAKEIIEEVFSDRGMTDYETSKLSGSYRSRTYCVQYRETDFDFVSRIMEEEGIFYYFRHEQGRHVMVLCDNARAYESIDDSTVYMYKGRSGFERIATWARNHAVPTGGVVTRDYNPMEPTANMESNQPTTNNSADRGLTLYDYPGLYDAKGDGDGLASVRIEEEEAATERVVGRGEVRTFTPGGTFSVEGVPGEEGKTYALSWVFHRIVDNTQIVGQLAAPGYMNDFVCLPSSTVFRPPRVTPKAVVKGLQTAVVVGPSGSEIHTDEHGRIKVQFFWDRYGGNDENSSCWIRVAQSWAGPQWGAQFIPRMGHEVVVAFLEGDPDRPLVIGSVYNGRHDPPFDLPGNKTQSGVRSRSSLGGGVSNCNEFRFEDKMGEELLFLHAEKDSKYEVENDEDIYIGNKRTEVVDKGDEKVTLNMGSHTTTIKLGDETRDITVGKRTTTINGDDSLTVKTGNISAKANLGNIDIDATLGKISLTAMQSIELKVGMNSLKVDQMGVTINGMMVKVTGQSMTQISSSGMTTLSSSGMTTVSGTMTTVSGSGMLTLTGGMLMIG